MPNERFTLNGILTHPSLSQYGKASLCLKELAAPPYIEGELVHNEHAAADLRCAAITLALLAVADIASGIWEGQDAE